jgi:hypothetical protein
MFWAFSRPSSGARWLRWQPLVLLSYRGDSRAVFVVGPARPRTKHDCHHDTKVKPEAATAVIELLMMGGKTPKTCWAVNKRQDNKLENCFIWLVIYLNFIYNSFLKHIYKYVPCDLGLKPQTFTHTVPRLLPGQMCVWILHSHVNPSPYIVRAPIKLYIFSVDDPYHYG